MRRNYGRLYLKYFMINIKSILVYDMDYLFGVVAMLIKSVVNFCMLLLLFQLVDDIAGWSFEQMLFLYGMSTVSYALWHCFFIDIITIPTYIQSGEFDRFLLKPIDPLFQIMMEGFDEDGWGELVFGVAIMVIALVKMRIFTISLMLLPLFCISGCLVFAAISIACSAVAFYTVGNIDLTDNVMDFKEFAKYPITIFNGAVKAIFTFVIPVGFVAYYPSLMYIKEYHPFISLCAIPVSLVFYMASWTWWHYSLKRYHSSGH